MSQYQESSIRVLKGLEPVKQRPGMYTQTERPNHLAQEVIDNGTVDRLVDEGYAVLTPALRGFVSVEPLLRATYADLAGDARQAFEALPTRAERVRKLRRSRV